LSILPCSHESSLPTKEKIISRALAHPVGLLRKLHCYPAARTVHKAGIEVSDELEKAADFILTSIDWPEAEILEIRHFKSDVGCEHGCSLFRVSE
jgi:hypothetical protein